MRVARQNTAPCGHPNPHGLTIVHNGWWGCPHCAAIRFFERNQGVLCESASRERAKGNLVEAQAMCEMALACGPCPRKGGCQLAAVPGAAA